MKFGAIFGLVTLLTTAIVAQTGRVQKGDRPVFYSAGELAVDCQDFLKVFPGGKPLPDNDERVAATYEEVIRAFKCVSYIDGVYDAELERTFASHYRPVSTRLREIKALIDTMLKYLADHPEEQDFAASTILNKAEKLVANAQASGKSGKP